MRKINLIVIHCSDTYARMDIGVNEIRQWHLQRGFNDIGYHYVIRRDGAIEQGRPIEKPGAHAAGYNTNSIGICYAGGKGDNNQPEDNRTPEQKQAMYDLVASLKPVSYTHLDVYKRQHTDRAAHTHCRRPDQSGYRR